MVAWAPEKAAVCTVPLAVLFLRPGTPSLCLLPPFHADRSSLVSDSPRLWSLPGYSPPATIRPWPQSLRVPVLLYQTLLTWLSSLGKLRPVGSIQGAA